MDVGCHILDRIDYLCGPLINVQGRAERRNRDAAYRVEDFVHLQATIGPSDTAILPSTGASVSCTWDFNGGAHYDQLEIETDTRLFKMVGVSPNAPILVCDLQRTTVLETYEVELPEHTGSFLTQAVTDELAGTRIRYTIQQHDPTMVDSMISRADNAIRTQRVLDTVLKTYYGTREIGFWDIDVE